MRWLPLLLLLATAGLAQSPTLLVVTKQSHALALVDTGTLEVRTTIPIGEDPHEVVVAPDGRTAYVSNYGEGTLHTLAHVDLVTGKPLPQVDISPLRGAHGLAVHDGMIWFTAEGSKALARLDPATNRVVEVLGTGQDKTHVVWVSRDGSKIVASNPSSATISIFDRTVNTPLMVAGAPAAPAAYTGPTWHHTIVPVGLGAEGFAVSPDETELWAGAADGTLPIVDLRHNQLLTTLPPTVPGANRLAFSPDGKLLLITGHTAKDLVVLDPHTRAIVKRIPIEERGASGIQIEPGGQRAFIACPRDHIVAVVNLLTLTKTGEIHPGREPDGLALWSPQASKEPAPSSTPHDSR